jgi:Lrp/AsnC family transcriptional regulator, leucine-responsive regulatory protein
MAVSLDEVDVQILAELQADADRTNVDLARLIGLSPAATLHRVRRLKESGIIRQVVARLDPMALGFPLQVYLAVTLARHDARTNTAFENEVRAIPQVIAADYVAGETDAILLVVARDVPELQQVLTRLAVRGGTRLITYLRLQEIKPTSPLVVTPREATASGK